MKSLSGLLIFTTGALVGSVITWKMLEAKYKRIADEEIEQVKAVYARRSSIKSVEAPIDEERPKEKDPDLFEYAEMVSEEGYTDYSEPQKTEKAKVVTVPGDAPYIISPEEFDEIYGYTTESLTYYADGIVTDEFDEPMEDDEVEDAVGRESLSHFGQYEEDSVFVRNDARRTDYEILLDVREYKERNK